MQNFNYTIGNRTSDLPACSAVPEPTALPRKKKKKKKKKKNSFEENVHRY
jgi:hypothetical protein